MSLHALATDMASKGRNGDSMLVHMTPGEVAGLHALALKHGGSLTINPDTGLPEANFLKSLLPAIIGFGLNYFVPGFGSAIAGGLGIGGASAAAIGTGIGVGGITGLATGSLQKGLMAGLGAYGGAGLQAGLAGAGADALTREALSVEGALPSLENITQVTGEGYGGSAANYSDQVNSAVKAARDTASGMPTSDLLSAGAKAAGADPMGFARQNMMPLAAAAAPIMAGMMVPTTTKASTPVNPGRIREKRWNGRYFEDVANTDANVFNTSGRSFSDPYRGYNNGGIVALARGGAAHFEEGGGVVYDYGLGGSGSSGVGGGDYSVREDGSVDYFANQFAPDVFAPAANTGYQSVNDLYQGVLGRGVESEGAAGYWQNKFGDSIDANELAEFKTAAQPELDARNATAGANTGITSLIDTSGTAGVAGATTPAYTNQYTYANINDYIANNNLDATGIAAAAKTFNVDPAQVTAAQNAQSVVSNVFRNVLGRDPDPNGLDYWTNQIMTGKSTGQEMLNTFIQNAKANNEIIVNPNIKLDDAVKEFGGYKSSNARDIADEWVRNTLGREVTEADRKQQWYKDAVNDAVMNTYGKAQDIYGGFKTYAQGEATATTTKAINDAKASLAARGLTEADVVKQTGKTIAQLVEGGTNLGLDLYQASQLKAPGAASKFNFNTISKAAAVPPVVPPVIPPSILAPINATQNTGTNVTVPTDLYTAPATSLPVGVSGNTGPSQIGGGATVNPNGTITTSPRIPGIPVGGFTGMQNLRDVYTKGGGSLGYTSPTYTPEEFTKKYVDRLSGDSKAAYDFLTGKAGAKYPTKSGVGRISEAYDEAVLGYPARGNLPYIYNKDTGKMDRNPDYVAPGRDAAGNVTYSMSLNDIKSTLKDTPMSGQALYDWAMSNNLSAQQIADATGRSLSSVYSDFRAGSKSKTAADKKKTDDDAAAASVNTQQESTGLASGGMPSYALGGLGTLGGYSDGGRLLRGPGDGVSDSIPATIGRKQQPARLADGEFVVPARIVSELGNGSTDAGAKKLYAMMDRVQRARGKTTGKNKVAANSRADKYLPA